MRKIAVLILSALIITLGFVDARAEINLSVMPVSGGNSLRFGRIFPGSEVNQEVRIRVTSTDGNQYQVFHRQADPFINEKNAPLGNDVISTYTLVGSNSSGTLYAQNVERMGSADQLLYTSGSGGESDNFTVAYAIDANRVSATGNFLGRIQYTVRPIGGAGQNNVILNATVEVSGDLTIEVEGSSTADTVRLQSKEGRDKEAFVRLRFRENLGQEIKVFQEAEPFPQDDLLAEIGENVILFAVSGSTKGEMSPQAPSRLMRKRSLVYSSRENEDTFYINFTLNQDPVEQQKAGIYKGRLRYLIETGQAEHPFDIALEVQIDPVFSIEVDLPSGGLNFERLLPSSPPITSEVNVQVKTNLGRAYAVMQSIVSPLTNEKGDVMPGEYFTIKGEVLGGTAGRAVCEDFCPAVTGENAIFFSDNKGAPSRFKMIYRLRPFPGMAAGSYTTSIRYSLGEM
ncbi:MAG: hypothetical protein WC450_11240 [Candidatus Omnitrophota bacterium]|jgi:hypothetical protein